MTTPEPRPDPFHTRLLQTFRFEVVLTRSGSDDGTPERFTDGSFQECSGLELEADVKDYLEGGRNDGVVRRVGRVKLQPIVLKRGLFALDGGADSALWDWLQGMVAGVLPIARYDGVIAVKDATGAETRATWRFVRGLPVKVTGPALNAKSGDIAIEELHIVHEGLRMVGR
ncbi:phage tail protein [Streptomyces griseorubiginosus]|uniref:phage tail protein n=1 Tax=Streptomyces griseorubiginosus TaxID=67304 RepID=UPI0036EA9BD1